MEKKEFNPSALGLFGLAMVTLVASAQKFGLIDGTMPVVAWAIFLGAGAQLLAGIYDAKNGVVFGATAFFGYALFWFAIAFDWISTNSIGFEPQLGMAFVGYFIFTLFMTIGSLKTNKVLFVIFVLIDFLFLGLAVSAFTGSHFFHNVAAVSEFLISIVAFYGFGANIINHQFDKEVLKLGKAMY